MAVRSRPKLESDSFLPPPNHEEWEEFQSRVVAQLPPGILPAEETEWAEFQILVARQLRPAFRPGNDEEWALFREHTLAQMLVSTWLESIYISQMPERWTEFEHRLPRFLQPLTLMDFQFESTLLRMCTEIPNPSYYSIPDFSVDGKMKAIDQENVEIKRELWEKQLAWRIATQDHAARKKRREETGHSTQRELSPECRPELLLAVQVEPEWEEEEARQRAQIEPHLPVALRPRTTYDWMKLDCRVLSQMPLEARLDSTKNLSSEWRAKESQWEEWEKRTAWKLLARYQTSMEKWEAEVGDPIQHPCGHWLTTEDWIKFKNDEWSKRIFAQLPLRLRPKRPEDWQHLRLRLHARKPAPPRLDSALQLNPEWSAVEKEWEDWEKLVAWETETYLAVLREQERRVYEEAVCYERSRQREWVQDMRALTGDLTDELWGPDGPQWPPMAPNGPQWSPAVEAALLQRLS